MNESAKADITENLGIACLAHPERLRDLHHVDDGRVPFAPLDHADVVVVESGLVGKGPLR